MIRADFHIHTTASDGRQTPAAILRQAANAGLTHIAITDHDTVDGLISLQGSNEDYNGLALIPGIEFSTDLPDCEVHILGYDIDINNDALREQLTILKDNRAKRVGRMADKLCSLGYQISEQEILRHAKQATSVGRPHVAKALVEKGYFATVGEVFDALLSHDKPGYVPHYKLTPFQVISLIRAAGGVPILAHPGLIGNEEEVEKLILGGIAGLEVYHPEHAPGDVERYRLIVKERSLMATGGSDYHAIPGRFPEKLGVFCPPPEVAAAFLAKINLPV